MHPEFRLFLRELGQRMLPEVGALVLLVVGVVAVQRAVRLAYPSAPWWLVVAAAAAWGWLLGRVRRRAARIGEQMRQEQEASR